MQWVYFAALPELEQLFFYTENGKPFFCFPDSSTGFADTLHDLGFSVTLRGLCAPLSYTRAEALLQLPGATLIDRSFDQIQLPAPLLAPPHQTQSDSSASPDKPLLPLLQDLWANLRGPLRPYALGLDTALRIAGPQNEHVAWQKFVAEHPSQTEGFIDWINLAVHRRLSGLGWNSPLQTGSEQEWPKTKGHFEISLKEPEISQFHDLPTFIFRDTLGGRYEMRLGFSTTLDMLVSELDVPANIFPITEQTHDENHNFERDQPAQQPLVADAAPLSAGQPTGSDIEEVSGNPGRPDDRTGREDAQRPSEDHDARIARSASGADGGDSDGHGMPPGRNERELQSAGRGHSDTDMGLGGESSRENNPHRNLNMSEPTDRDGAHFFLPPETLAYPTGLAARASSNLAAIHLLKILQAEGRLPNDAEKKILAGFSGWGGLGATVFPDDYLAYARRNTFPSYLSEAEKQKYEHWKKVYGDTLCPKLGGVLSEDEWHSATTASLNAHYTSPEVVSAMWDMAQRLGFRGGVIVEPAAGTGAFLRYMPRELAENSSIQAVELDDVSGQILACLYPDAQVEVCGLEKSKVIKDNSADLLISNVPFGNYNVYDPQRKSYNSQSIHNYFISRALDTVRPGGLVLVITSRYSLDAISGGALRAGWTKKADLLGAARLPKTAFQESANTEVVADLLVFRKKSANPCAVSYAFQHTAELDNSGEPDARINEYFIIHPEMVLGKHDFTHGLYSSSQYTVLPDPNESISEGLQRILQTLPENLATFSEFSLEIASQQQSVEKIENVREGSLVLDNNGVPVFIENGFAARPSWGDNARRMEQAQSYCALKSCLTQLMEVMNNDFDESRIEGLQKKLNQSYDAYVARYGCLTQGRKNSFLQDDVEFPNMEALENCKTALKTDSRTGESFFEKEWIKADIFSKRTIYPFRIPDTAETIEDAIKISKIYFGNIDIVHISSLLHVNKDIATQLALQSGEVFQNPGTGLLESKDIYLSGNVKVKLLDAEQAAEHDKTYQQNVDALLQVQPVQRTIADIYVRLGTSWLSTDIVESFLSECGIHAPRVTCMRIEGSNLEDGVTEWSVAKNYRHVMQEMKWQVNDSVGILDLVEDCLNLRMTKVYDAIKDMTGKNKLVENKQLSLSAQEKQRELQELFKIFVRSNQVCIGEIEETYNRLFNNHVLRQFPVPDIDHFPGASKSVSLRPNQKQAVARGVQESTLIAHSVGTGKTFTLISIAMEMRRLKTARKPWIVIQGSTVPQFAAAFKRLYPNANILVPTEAQRTAANRKKLLAQIATGDWDAIITPHSFFNSISVSPEVESRFISESLAQYSELASASRFDRRRTSHLKRKIKKLKARLEQLLDIRKDDNVYFENLGVDALLVDEAHTYKRGSFETKMDNVKGLDRDSSQRSMQFLLKSELVRAKTGGKNIILATGTPISNTLTELWTLFRYFRPDLLEEFNVTQFDDFASTFAETSVALEETATGDFKMVERFNKYVNGLELLSMWRTGADVALAEDMPYLVGRPKLTGGKPQEIAVERSEELADYIRFLKSQRDRWDRSAGSYKQQHPSLPLEIYGKARRASIDLRLVDPARHDVPGSKANMAVDNIFQCWKDTTASKSAQILFADSFQSSDQTFNLFRDIKDKLCARGMPASEIAIIHDYPTDKAREELYNAVCAGAVRLIMGTTEKLGTGVNVQERLIAEHNIDMPFRPMDFEQRQGRIERPGNLNPEVSVFVYGTKDTLDSVIMQQVISKQKFINQILRGDVQTSTFENPFDEVQSSFEDLLAAFSGNPLTKEKVQLQTEIRKLETLQDVHFRHMADVRHQKKCNLNRQSALRRNLPVDYQVQNFVKQYYPDGIPDGKAFAKTIGDWLSHAKQTIQARLEKINAYHAWLVRKEKDFVQTTSFPLPGGLTATIKIEGDIRQSRYQEELKNEQIMSYSLKSPCGIDVSGSLPAESTVLRHLEKALLAEAERPSLNEARIAQLEAEDVEADAELSKPFKQEEELKALRVRLEKVEEELANALNLDLAQTPQDPDADDIPVIPSIAAKAAHESDLLPVGPCV